MAATWVTLDGDNDNDAAAFGELEQRTLDLRKCHKGPTAPVPAVDGELWLDDSAVPWVLKQLIKLDAGASAWQPIGIARLGGSINADPDITDNRQGPYEHKALRVENRAALPAAAAGNAGLLVYKTGDGELWIADQPVSGEWKGMLSIAADSLDTVELSLDGDLGNDAVDPPVQTAKGVLEGWLFDDVAQKRTLVFPVPSNWHGASDLELRLHQVLNANETAGDDIEWSGEYRVLPAAAGKVSQAATAFVDVATDIGADADGIADGGGPHVSKLVIDHDDGTNPTSAGALILATVWRTSVGGAGLVAGSIVYRAELAYRQKPRHARA